MHIVPNICEAECEVKKGLTSFKIENEFFIFLSENKDHLTGLKLKIF